jgi:hypothetical protein
MEELLELMKLKNKATVNYGTFYSKVSLEVLELVVVNK